MMNGSDDRTLIIPALVEALGALEDIPKHRTAEIPTKTGGKYSYSYADLKDVLHYLRPKLAEHGLAVMQQALTAEGGTAVTTTILHESGQWLESAPLRMPAGTDAQSHGSAVTFGRRYSLLAMLGLATEDDDGAAAHQRPAQARNQSQGTRKARTPGAPTEAVTKRVMAMFKEAGMDDRDERLSATSFICKRQVASWSEVTAAEADEVIGTLDNLIKGRLTVDYDAAGDLTFKEAS